MTSQAVGVHIAARQKKINVYFVVIRVSRSSRYSYKKMCVECIQYSGTEHWSIIRRDDVYMKWDNFIVRYI
jgi:hypothetical protein